ncbi:hypothetical protein FDECE_4001 [Fusarium decemcellulare]|nr:hypothetical protein FDECE_4001 [Fusarium decemcellulare]
MDKCWFVLSQTHYPPPQEDESDENGAVKQMGPICLGHFIKDLKHLDQVINSGGPEPFLLDMPIYHTPSVDFEWEITKEHGLDASTTAEVPVATVPGVSAKASLGFALKKSVRNYWQIEKLDTMVVQPSRAYITRSLATAPIAEFLEHNRRGPTWSIFMITGLKIVRGNSTHETSRGRESGVHGGPGIGVAGVAEANLDVGISSSKTTSVSAKQSDDFIWAVRLSKITKVLPSTVRSFVGHKRAATRPESVSSRARRWIGQAFEEPRKALQGECISSKPHDLLSVCQLKSKSRLASLKALVSDHSPSVPYPGLEQVRQNKTKNAEHGIRKLAEGQGAGAIGRREGLLKMLMTLSNSLTLEDETVNTDTKKEGEDYTGSIRKLYKVLSEYLVCDVGSEKKDIAGKLRLGVESKSQNDFPAFDLMFLTHPHKELCEEPFRWRETCIQVDPRETRFAVETNEAAQLIVNGPIHITDFCERISASEQYQLSLVASGQKLHFVELCEGAKSWVPSSPSVPLSIILRNHKLSQKMKYLLSYLLAKSVWQFYNTNWMGKEWTKDSIHFMYERRKTANDAGIYLNEPFISAYFDPDLRTDDARFRPHKFPKIKALGIILLEIELGTVIEDHFGPDSFALDGQPNTDADLHTALRLYDDPDNLEDSHRELKAVIGHCLRPSKFTPHRQNVDDLREALQVNVVDRLHTLVEVAYGEPDKIQLRPTVRMPSLTEHHQVMKRRSASQIAHLQHQEVPLFEVKATDKPQATKTGAVNGCVSSCIEQASSEAWFDELDKLTSILTKMPGETDQNYRRIRIAVIDTGIDGKDTYARYIRGYRDFVSGQDDVKQDNTGHGTGSVKLIFKLYAEAEVYVARVFENDQANDDTQDLMLKAICYSKETWKVDIISIASGFESEHHDMRTAIKKVACDGTLVFAAASNYGNIRHVTFPARMNDVICMFCTDGRAKVSQSINPAPQKTKSRNFAILGENVIVPPSLHNPLTGTSVATCIAAGLAGRLLDFSCQMDGQQRIRCVHQLASVEGMSAVFSHMARGAEDNNYNCVVPGRLLQHLGEDDQRQVQRERICERLSAALENVDMDL